MFRHTMINTDPTTRAFNGIITNVENHFGELCQIFAAYVRKTARLRDKGDLLVRELIMYAATETPTLKQGLQSFAGEIAKLQDLQHATIRRFEDKVVEPLKIYGTITKIKRKDISITSKARQREAKKRAKLEKIRQQSPWDQHAIMQAEMEFQRASKDANQKMRFLSESFDNFEKKKIKDIKSILSEFVTIEVLFYGQALELCTAAFHSIQAIDENGDFEAYQNALPLPNFSIDACYTSSLIRMPPVQLQQDKSAPADQENPNKPRRQKVNFKFMEDESGL